MREKKEGNGEERRVEITDSVTTTSGTLGRTVIVVYVQSNVPPLRTF